MSDAFSRIKAGLEDALAFADGDASRGAVHVPASVDVKAIRRGLGLTQAEFAANFGLGLGRVRDWEQGRTRPDGAARAYLMVIAHDHHTVERALRVA